MSWPIFLYKNMRGSRQGEFIFKSSTYIFHKGSYASPSRSNGTRGVPVFLRKSNAICEFSGGGVCACVFVCGGEGGRGAPKALSPLWIRT